MERLTEKDSNGNYKIEVDKLEYWCTSGDGKKPRVIRGQHINRLAEYEDLEERLQSVYGECEGLLEKVVEHLERHEGINFQNPASKARLLTDEEVDRWEELQRYRQSAQSLKENMERLTSNKPVSEMGMYELALNSCYIKDGKVRVRDFENDSDARELTRKILEDIADDAFIDNTDETFDGAIADYLQYGTSEPVGLIAVFYRNLCAMADLRERLKKYEDLEEQGKLLKLPCAVGDKVYAIMVDENNFEHFHCRTKISELQFDYWMLPVFGKSIFLTREGAEAALKRGGI